MSAVTLLPGGQVLSVETGESILGAGLRAGFNLPHSCKGGHCGSCRARIVTGRVHYPAGEPAGITALEQREGYALLCQARALTTELTVEIRQTGAPPAEIQVRNLPCRIERRELLAPDVMAVTLQLPQAEEFNFLAGQYIDILLSGNRRRSFSLANSPRDDNRLMLHIRRVPGGEFTQQLFTSMQEKTQLRMEGPLGQFWFRGASPRPALFVAGGTGYAPLRAMLQQLQASGDTRPLKFYWGVRALPDLYAAQEVRNWAQTWPSFSFHPVLSEPRPEDAWTGRKGLVPGAVIADELPLKDFDVYAAGPPAMIGAIQERFAQLGLPAEQLFFDSFDYAAA